MNVSSKDKQIVRALARRVAEIAADPVHELKAAMWRRHNDLDPVRPMVLIFPEGAWTEVMADWTLQCESEVCRGLEREFRMRIYWWEHLRDDNVMEPVVRCPIAMHSSGYGIEARRQPADVDKGAYHIEPVIVEEGDLDKIKIPEITVDWEATRKSESILQELIGDILAVQTSGFGSVGWAPMDMFITWRGIDQLFMDLHERPEWVHRAMQKLLDCKLAEIDALEKQGALTLNNRNHYCGSGGVGYTHQLPQPDFDGQHVRPVDLWAMATAQIFSDVSPAMHEEFALHYERQFLERFGLANYGCCEPLHRKLESVKKIRNLRRVSISPWADVEICARELGRDFVFSWKPNPAVIAEQTWKPEKVRGALRDFCERTRNCVTDIIMKDTHTCRNEPRRLSDWTRIAVEVAEEFAV